MSAELGPREPISPDLAASFGPGQLRQGRDHDAVDGRLPAVVITARDEEDVRTVVSQARRQPLAIIVSGGATLLEAGYPPSAFDVRLSTTGMALVSDRRPEDMTVTVQAGVTLGRLNRSLVASGQRVALDPLAPDRATVGGIVASAASGGLVYGFGGPRDLVLGLTLVDGCARLLRVGGKVVKNVAGYDLPRLFTGSFGTLGVITEVTLRTHPIAEEARTLRLCFPDALALETARQALFTSELPLCALDFENVEDGATNTWCVIARIEGTRGEVDYQQARLGELCGTAARLEEGDWISPIHPRPEEKVVLRTGALPAGLLRLAARLRRMFSDAGSPLRLAGRLGDGLLRVCLGQADETTLASRIEMARMAGPQAGGRVIVERMPARWKETIDPWGAKPPGFALMQRIKQRFDPTRIFAPGRFAGRL